MVVFNKGLEGFFHSLVPRRLRETLKPNTANYVRARALSAALLVCTLVPAVATIIVGAYHLFIQPDLLVHDLISLALAFVFGIQAILFCRFGNQWLSSTALSNIYFLLIAILLVMSGGITSPMKAIVVTCPIMSFVIGGRQEGLQSTLMTVLFILGLAVLSAIEFELPNLFRAENPIMIFVVNWVGTVTIITFCVMVYEIEIENNCEYLKTHKKTRRQEAGDLSERIDSFMRRLIPKILRETLDPNSMGYIRVQTLSIMLYLATLMSAVSGLILVSVHFFLYKEQLKYDLIIMAITFAFGLQTWLFCRFNNFWLSSLFLGYFYLVIVLLLVGIGGGYHSPVMVLMLSCPTVFFMLGGIQQGVRNAVFIIITGMFFGSMKAIGYELPNVFHAANPVFIYTIAFVISVVSIMLCMMVYDTELEKRN